MSIDRERIVLVLEAPEAGLTEIVRRNAGPNSQVLTVHSGQDALRAIDRRRVAAVIVHDAVPDHEIEPLPAVLLSLTSPPPLVLISDRADQVTGIARDNADYVVDRTEVSQALVMIINHAMGTAVLQELVAASEQQYRDLIEASNDAIYIFADSRFAFVNRRFTELFGFDRTDLTERKFDFRQLVHPESLPLVEARVAGAQGGQPMPTRYEFRALRKDGSAFDVEVSVSYITYDMQPAALGILQDITARKAYEKTLLRKNHELSVLNAVAEAITQVNELASVLDGVMERLIELLGVDAAGLSLLDDDDPERFASVHYRGCSETFVESMRLRSCRDGVLGLALATGELQVIDEIELDERVAVGAAVQEGFRSAVALPLINQQRTFGVVTVFTRTPRDFSEDDIRLFQAVAHQLAVAVDNARLYRKARQGVRRLEALSEIARAIGSTLDVEGVFQIVGERLAALIPYQRIALLIVRQDAFDYSVRTIDRPGPGEPPVVRLKEPIEAPMDSPLKVALAEHATQLVAPGHLDVPSVAPHPGCATAIVPIHADQMDQGLFVVSLPEGASIRNRDLALLEDLAAHMAISLKNARMFEDLQGAYQELKDAKDKLVRSEKLHSLGEMAAGVAHDFNNVLSAILGRAQMMKVFLQEAEMQKNIRIIEKAALDGAGTVRRIQEFAKAKSDLAFVLVRLNPIVREVVERCAMRFDSTEAPVERQMDLGEPPLILGNPSELREVLTNLIYNALDAMPHGGRLAVRTGTTDHRFAFVEVSDTGVGMDQETQNKIFDPFFTTKGAQGTGLGMSVSYGIVQRHSGEFTVESGRGQGATIRVALPAAPQASQIPAAGPGSPDGLEMTWLDEVKTPPPVQFAIPGKVARILVIDDDIAVRDVLADILRTGSHRVVAASSGEEGMALFADEEFDVVFTDLGMPGMNGWEVARGIKTMRPGTPVGLITGWGSSLEEAQLSDHGVDLIVPKPFRLEQVLELVNEAVNLRGRLG